MFRIQYSFYKSELWFDAYGIFLSQKKAQWFIDVFLSKNYNDREWRVVEIKNAPAEEVEK